MAPSIQNSFRDQLITAFRGRLCDKLEITPFPHQGSWWAAADGEVLLDIEEEDPTAPGMVVRLADGRLERRSLIPRSGGRARVIADLGAFKIGKSYSSALWTAAFACIPNARVQLVGLEYDICAPEFEYICEFLLSDRGMGMKADSVQNRPRDGRMWLDIAETGARFEAKSWERKDTMKGKEIDCYLYCEAYMLPGLECYTSFSQNLRARNGYAVFATTPDRPWVQEIHNAAHSGMKEFDAWHCTCGVHSSQNHYTFDQGAMDRDRNLMTREKFQIHYEGKLGDFVGRVYNYQRGERTFTPATHPHLFNGNGGGRENLRIPDGWKLESGADTGTYSSAITVAFSPDGDAFVLEEFPNYRYVAGVPELDESVTIPSWAGCVADTIVKWGGQAFAWADQNSQFKREVQNYGLTLESNRVPLEARTEIAREYFKQDKVWLAPWLQVLPFELENACWPEEATSSGKFARIKDRDHTLDGLEHVLSKRPRGKGTSSESKKKLWIEQFMGRDLRGRRNVDPHLGRY